MHFVYVMSKTDKKKMLSMGYKLLKEDKQNKVWVFQNKDQFDFATGGEIADAGISFILSDMLTF